MKTFFFIFEGITFICIFKYINIDGRGKKGKDTAILI